MTALDIARGAKRYGIVSIAVEHRDPHELVGALRRRNVSTSAQIRAYAVIDYDRKGVATSLRLSPHYFNTEAELAQAAGALRELLSG